IDMTGALFRWSAKKPVPPPAGSQDKPTQITWDVNKDGSPYPGLMHFTRKYSRVFFGREDDAREILYRMRQSEERFIIISGGSGTGKSSLVDAGVLPKLEDDVRPGSEGCMTVRMVPGLGSEPFGALMTVLGSFASRAGLRPDVILEELKVAPDTLTEQVRKII